MSVDDRRTTGPNAAGSYADEPSARLRYRILLPIASGGAATLSIALAEGVAGFSKLVVLKTIRDDLTQNVRATRTFLEEARLSALMNHPNVVQVYEVFLQRNAPVIAMEFLDGQPLNTLLAQPVSKLPSLELAAAILAKVLAGLHYSHTLRDASGEPLGLIHRDVSPHNVMVTHDGQVKLIDFGIAKLSRSEHRTRTGVVKGKLTYMAPEQFTGTTDHRADTFGVGVMLWEFAARQRFWGDLLEPAIIGRLVSGQLPHLHTRPEMDAEVWRICERALAPRVEDRYSSAAEMQADLEAYLAARGVVITPRAIGQFVSQTCAEARRAVQAELAAQLSAHGLSWTESGDGPVSHLTRSKPISPAAAVREPEAARGSQPGDASGERMYSLGNRTQLPASRPHWSEPHWSEPHASESARTPPAFSPEVLPDALAPEPVLGNGSSDGAPLRLFGGATPTARAVVAIAGFGIVAVLVFALGLRAPEPSPSAPALETAIAAARAPATPGPRTAPSTAETTPLAASRIRIVASAEPKAAKWYLDDVEMGSSPLQTSAARDAKWHTLRAEAEGYQPFVKKFQFDANIDVTVALTPK